VHDITQEELHYYSEFQAVSWAAGGMAYHGSLDFQRRLRLGAQIEPGPLTFDMNKKMVRTRKVG
jgi:hypothetical protein